MQIANGATLFKQVDYSLSKLIHDIEMGEIGLPDIQRPFVWTPAKVRDLFDSMYKGFPVGYLLFWSNSLGNGTRQIGIETKQKISRLLIVDGQQRLTSLYAVLRGIPVMNENYDELRISIAFKPKNRIFEVTDVAIKRDPEWISDISALWSGTTTRNRFVKDFINNLRMSRQVDEKEEDDLVESIDHLYDVQNYPFTAMELSAAVSEEQVSDVFVRINSKGVELNQADFILTLMSVFWDQGRKELEDFCRKARKPSIDDASPFNHFIEPNPDELLRIAIGLGFRRARLKYAYFILRGKDLETEQFSDELRIKQFDVLKEAQTYILDLQNWHEFLKTLVKAGYRSGKMITSKMSILYSYVMFLIGKKEYKMDNYQLRNLIARWFFMSSITGRYTSSPESAMEMDLSALRGVKTAEEFSKTLDKIINDSLTEDFWNITLPNDLEAASTRSPSLFAYFAALNLVDAQVLFSKMKISELLDPAIRAKKAPLEVHHLFPKNYLRKIGIAETIETNQIGNYALLEWPDNLDISDLSPSDYLEKYFPRLSKEMQYWHALPDSWENMKYSEFLITRRNLIAQVTRDGYQRLLDTNK